MNLKALTEKRNALLEEMNALLHTAEVEKRALNGQEDQDFTAKKQEIEALDRTIQAAEEARQLETSSTEPAAETERRSQEEADFLHFIRTGQMERRSFSVQENGALVPSTIADRMIEKVKEICPIYQMVSVFQTGEDLVFPVYHDTESGISAAYSDEFTELTEKSGKFSTVKLTNHIVGCLAKISRTLIHCTDINIADFIILKVANAFVEFLEKELLAGTEGKMQGVLSCENGITASASSALTADDFIDLHDTVPDVFQGNACWIMNKSTRTAIRKLKDSNGDYLLNKDLNAPYGYSLLGKPVYVSENMPKAEAGKAAVVYGDMSGLYLKFAQEIQIQVLMEKYATQHAIGVVGYMECDSKLVEPQKLAVLTMKAEA